MGTETTMDELNATATPSNTQHENDLEVNLRECADLSRALWLITTGLTNDYPHEVMKADLDALHQLADEVHVRAAAANRQWHEE